MYKLVGTSGAIVGDVLIYNTLLSDNVVRVALPSTGDFYSSLGKDLVPLIGEPMEGDVFKIRTDVAPISVAWEHFAKKYHEEYFTLANTGRYSTLPFGDESLDLKEYQEAGMLELVKLGEKHLQACISHAKKYKPQVGDMVLPLSNKEYGWAYTKKGAVGEIVQVRGSRLSLSIEGATGPWSIELKECIVFPKDVVEEAEKGSVATITLKVGDIVKIRGGSPFYREHDIMNPQDTNGKVVKLAKGKMPIHVAWPNAIINSYTEADLEVVE